MNKENTNKDNLSQDIINKIKEEKINPYSYWYINLRTLLVWIPSVLIIIIGSFSFAGLLFGFVHAPWGARSQIHPSIFIFIIRIIPLVWVCGISLFVLAIVRSLRNTKNVYRYSASRVFIISFLVSIFLGALIFVVDSTFFRNPALRYPSERQYKRIMPPPRLDMQNERNLSPRPY